MIKWIKINFLQNIISFRVITCRIIWYNRTRIQWVHRVPLYRFFIYFLLQNLDIANLDIAAGYSNNQRTHRIITQSWFKRSPFQQRRFFSSIRWHKRTQLSEPRPCFSRAMDCPANRVESRSARTCKIIVERPIVGKPAGTSWRIAFEIYRKIGRVAVPFSSQSP